jgi:DNA repair exonuclease SbcCD ATPase subunit
MSERNSPADSAEEYSDAQATLADTIQMAQDNIEDLEDEVPVDALELLETVEEDVEALEDAVEDADGEVDGLPDGFEADIQAAQDDVQSLQETLNLAGADRDILARAEDLEDTVETVEDRAADTRGRYGVKVGTAPVEFFNEESPTAEDILGRFGEDTDDVLVEKGTENTYSGDDEVPLGGRGIERFEAEPRTDGNS